MRSFVGYVSFINKKNRVCCVMLLLLFQNTIAQNTISQNTIAQNTGTLKYDVEIIGTNEESIKTANLLFGSSLEMFVNNKESNVSFKMGKLYNMTTITNLDSNVTIFHSSNPVNKVSVRGTLADFKKMQVKDTTTTVAFFPETKLILGYPCKKAVLTFSNGEKGEYWYTTAVNLNLSNSDIKHPLLPGIPLEFSKLSNGYFMTYKASFFSNEVPTASHLFSLNPLEGSTFITFEEYWKIMAQTK